MSARRFHGGLATPAALAAIALSGCVSGSPQTGARTFISEHGAIAASVAAATLEAEAAASRVAARPTRPQLSRLAALGAQARRELLAAAEWNVAGRGEEGAEEEDVPRAESQVTEGAGEIASAMSSLDAYAHAPSAATLAAYQTKLAEGRSQWNEGISQLWYLAHTASPPTV